MTYLIELIGNTTIRVTSVLLVGSTNASNQYEQTIHININGLLIPERCCCSLESLWDEHTILLWKSEQERDLFIALTKKWMRIRIKRHSVILPKSVILKIEDTRIVTPTILGAIFSAHGLKSEQDIKKLKSSS